MFRIFFILHYYHNFLFVLNLSPWYSAAALLYTPPPSLFTWPALTGCLDSLYSFTLLSYLQYLFSIFPLSLLILLPMLKKKKIKEKKKQTEENIPSCYNQVTYLYLCLYILSSLLLLWMNSLCFHWRTFLPLVHLLKHIAPGIFVLDIIPFPRLNYSKSIQAFCYLSHLKKIRKKILNTTSFFYLICSPLEENI